jgi:hypothetical protein
VRDTAMARGQGNYIFGFGGSQAEPASPFGGNPSRHEYNTEIFEILILAA